LDPSFLAVYTSRQLLILRRAIFSAVFDSAKRHFGLDDAFHGHLAVLEERGKGREARQNAKFFALSRLSIDCRSNQAP
jgi:hypothetical protein